MTIEELHLCECGCGMEVNPGRRFIIGHNLRGVPKSTDHRRKLSESHTGVPLSEAHVSAMAKSHNREKIPLVNGWEIDETSGMVLNKECSSFLGCFIAEQLLSKVFKDVQMMPYGNPGFDVICNRDFKIDIKSSATGYKGYWIFNIFKNQIADHFLCIAFDNRDDLNPEHVWLIPGDVLNHLTKTSISKSTLHKWSEYELSLDRVIVCCDEIKSKEKRKV